MENKLTKIRHTFAIQLTSKHKLRLPIPPDDSSDGIFELFVTEMSNQLHRKLVEQNKQLIDERNPQSPLFIQRKQLQRDIDDFQLLNQYQDARKVQQIIERVEHMALFNPKYHPEQVGTITQSNKQSLPTRTVISTTCSYRALCSELMDRLSWPSELFAPQYDRCFCKTCYPLAMPNISQVNLGRKHPAIIPRNWMKFGLKVDEVQAKVHQIWNNWFVSYHGTLPNAALSMIKHRQICLPGDTLADGTKLSIRTGHIPNERAFFTSPTIRYAAQNPYSTPMEFTSQIDKGLYTAKLVLRCRQMPSTFTIQSETLNNNYQRDGNDFCDMISDEQIEWRTDQRGSVVFDGLCVRLKQLSNSSTTNNIEQSFD